MQTLIIALAAVGGYCLGRAIVAIVLHMFWDRDGNSGRHKHWSEE